MQKSLVFLQEAQISVIHPERGIAAVLLHLLRFRLVNKESTPEGGGIE